MSKYISCIHLTMRHLQNASKRIALSTFNVTHPSQKLSATKICSHCQTCCFSNLSAPNNVSNKDTSEKTTGVGATPKLESSSELKTNEHVQKTAKGKHLKLSKNRNGFKDPSKYFEQKFLEHRNSFVEADLEDNEDRDIAIGKGKRQATDRRPTERFGTYAQKVLGKTETDMRNPNERIEETLPEDLDQPRDRRLDIPLTRDGRIGKSSFSYNKQIARYGHEGKIKEAIAVLEELMLIRDRVKPSKKTFIFLIGILGRVGYTKKAFELYTKMKHLNLDPEDRIYTSLFNACANSPFREDALRKAQDLLWSLQDRGVRPNIYTIKAAMKAFSLCGDFPMAFRLMDKASQWLRLDAECFNHLLMASISDKSKGFHRALQVWQKMKEYGVVPDTYTYNLLMRCVRDCSIGDSQEFAEYLGLDSSKKELDENIFFLGDEIVKTTDTRGNALQLVVVGKSLRDKVAEKKKKKGLKIEPGVVNIQKVEHVQPIGELSIEPGVVNIQKVEHVQPIGELSIEPGVVNIQKVEHVQPIGELSIKKDKSSNLEASEALATSQTALNGITDFSKSSYLSILKGGESVSALPADQKIKVSISDLKHPEGRLAALGGATSVLKHMERTGSQPSIQTYALILACIPNNEVGELQLLAHMERNNTVPDVDFLNDIMMRRNKRKEPETVKNILPVISRLRLTPNMRTFAALAMTCRKEKDAQELLNDMKAANLEPTAEVMGHLIYSSQMNYNYKLSMLMKLESLGLKPIKETIADIESRVAKTKKLIIEAEKNKDENNYFLSQQFQATFQKFLRFYRHWLQRTELDKAKHPWKAYEPTKDNSKDVKKSPDNLLI